MQKNKEDKAGILLEKVRRRLVEMAFQKYRKHVQLTRRAEVQLSRSTDLILTFQSRALREQVAAWCAYVHHHKRAKGCLSRAFKRMTRWKTARHFKRWVDWARLKNEELLQKELNKLTEKIATKNQVLSEYYYITEKQNAEVDQTASMAYNKAGAVLANYYARFYSSSCKKAFRSWKECCRNRK